MMTRDELIGTINSMRKLEKDWNGYGAEAFSDNLCDKVIDIINRLEDINLPRLVVPTGRNSIQMEWEESESNGYLEIEVFEDRIGMYREYDIQSSEIDDEIKTFSNHVSKCKEVNTEMKND